MSYLDLPRIHVSGEFYAYPSTINNDPDHYKAENENPSPWQTPKGDHAFYFDKATVTSAMGTSGPVSSDPILGAGFSSNQNARLVDLDVYQQAATTIFGMTISLQVGNTTLTGTMEPAILHGWWAKAVMPTRGWRPIDTYGQASYGGDANAAGSFVTRIRFPAADWPTGLSTTLDELRARQVGDDDILVAFRFALDGYQNVEGQAGFLRGRLSGALGPVLANEASGLLARRWLAARPDPTVDDSWNAPAFHGLPCAVDSSRSRLVMDMANGVPSQSVGGPPIDMGTLTVKTPNSTVGTFGYSGFVLASDAGIVELEIPAELLSEVQSNPLHIETSLTSIGDQTLFKESPDGNYVATNTRVMRLTPNAADPNTWPSAATSDVYVTHFGEPTEGIALSVAVVPVHGNTPGATVPGTQDGPDGPENPYYEGDTPQADGAVVAAIGETDSNGIAKLSAKIVKDPGVRTSQLDGQVYYVYPQLPGEDGKVRTQERNLSIVAWSDYPVVENPTWEQVEELMAPYAKLYPAMRDMIDLSVQSTFDFYCHNPPWDKAYNAKPREGFKHGAIPYYMTKDFLSTGYMPITRDLSPNKVATVLNYARNLQASESPPAEPKESK